MQAFARVVASRLRVASAVGAARWLSAGPGASKAAQAAVAADGIAAAAAAAAGGEGSTAAQAALLFGRSAVLYVACDTLAAAAHHPHVSGAAD